jgi:O-antigen/teichoic acid export membrane protein
LSAQHRCREMEAVLRGTATAAAIPAAIIFVVLMVFPGTTLAYVFGEYYRRGAGTLMLLAVGQLCNICTGSTVTALNMTGHPRVSMIITSGAGLIALTFAVLAGRGFGIEGIAMAFALGMFVENAATLTAARRVSRVWTHIDFRLISRAPAMMRVLRASV